MRKIFSCLFILLCCQLFAQEDYLVTSKSDTIFGVISFVYYEGSEVVLLKNENGKEKYRPYQLNSFVRNDVSYEVVIYDNRYIFAQKVVKGALSLYRIKGKDSHEYGQEVLLKINGESTYVPNISFKRIIVDFLSDCQEAAEKIQNRELQKKDIIEIVKLYNEICSDKVDPLRKQTIITTEKNDVTKLIELASLVRDMQEKIDKGEELPGYMINALKAYEGEDLSELIMLFLKDQ